MQQKIIRNRARIGIGERAVRGAKMRKPTEACEFPLPIGVPRRDLERQMPMRIDDLAGKSEIAGIDLRRDVWIGVMNVLWRDREPIRRFGSDQSESIEGPTQKSEKNKAAAAGKPADEPKPILPPRAAQVIPPSMATPTSDSY